PNWNEIARRALDQVGILAALAPTGVVCCVIAPAGSTKPFSGPHGLALASPGCAKEESTCSPGPPGGLQPGWLRYLERRLRERYDFTGNPIHFVVRRQER